MNRLLGKQSGFAVGPTVNPCTKGIYIWGQPKVIQRSDGSPLTVLFVDTEGIGSIQQDQTYDVKIFSLAVLLSSYFIYNSMAIIDERALDSLSLVVNLTKQISAKSSDGNVKGGKKGASKLVSQEESARELAEYFPRFLWLLRDFTLDLEDEQGRPITARQYLENSLKERPETAGGGQQQSKNGIRVAIKQLFRERDCVTLVRPVNDERQLKTIDSVPYQNLRPEFREQSDALVQKILEETPPKQLNGQNLNGESLAQLIEIYTNAINTGAVASIQSAWESLSTHVNQAALEHALETYETGIKAKYRTNRPVSDELLQQLHTEVCQEAFNVYNGMCYDGPSSSTLRKQLKAKLATELDRLIQANREASVRFVARILASLYEPLESAAKNGTYKTLESLIDAWNGLQKSFFEQVGDSHASKIVAYDEFLKFYSTHIVNTSASVSRTITQAHTAQIEELKKTQEKLVQDMHKSELAAVKATEESKRLSVQLEAAEKRVKQLEGDTTRLSAELKESKKHAADLQTQLTKVSADASKASADLVKANTELKIAQNNLSTQEAKLNAEIQRLGAEVQRLSGSLKDKSKEADEATKRADTTTKKLAEQEEKAKQAAKENTRSNEEAAKERSAAVEKSVQQVKKLEAALDKMTKERDAAAEVKGVLEVEKTTLATELSTARKQAETQATSAKKEIRTLTDKLEAEVAKVTKLTKDQAAVETMRLEIRDLKAKLDQMAREREMDKRSKETIEAEKTNLIQAKQKELKEANAELQALRKELAEKKPAAAPSRPSINGANGVENMFDLGANAQPSSSSQGSAKVATAAKANTSAKSTSVPSKSSRKKFDAPATVVEDDIVDDFAAMDEDVPEPEPTKKVAKRTKAVATKAVPSPARAAPSAPINPAAMDVDLPPAPSRKRARPTDFSEVVEEPEAGPRNAKVADRTPGKMSKQALKTALISNNVKLPASDQPKDYYEKLYSKHVLKLAPV